MGWRDLLEVEQKRIVAPWTGGRSLHFVERVWKISGPLPPEQGWYVFETWRKEAKVICPADPPEDMETHSSGFLVGDKIVFDSISATMAATQTSLSDLSRSYRFVDFIEPGLDRFARIEVGAYGGRLMFKGLAFPLGPEEEVLSAYLDRKEDISDIKGVTPALEVAFRMETLQRAEVDRRRIEAERLRREEEERLAQEERRAELAETLGDGAGRRAMAVVDFQAAATAALSVGGAELLDIRDGHGNGEKVVRYRLEGRRFECVCDAQMRIIDAGVCLTDESTGEKGDTFFTLESLPGVVKQAIDLGVLVVFRHV
jgi:hypothetical protein